MKVRHEFLESAPQSTILNLPLKCLNRSLGTKTQIVDKIIGANFVL